MAPNEAQSSAEQARKNGNDFYKAGKLVEAVGAYKQASDLDPSSAAPWSNLAAAYFELGQYEAAFCACNTALELLDDRPEHEASRQKTLLRKAKACLYSKVFDEALTTLEPLPPSKEKKELERCIRNYEGSLRIVTNAKAIHDKLILELPRYKPSIRSIAEYYCVGHDDPEILFDEDLLKSGRDRISFLFAGIGDARHLFTTMMMIGGSAVSGKIPEGKSFHFTILDRKAAVMARDLLMLQILNDMMVRRKSGKSTKGLPFLLYYLYLAPIMPASTFQLLQQQIQTAIDALEGRLSLPDMLIVPQMYRAEILRVLKEWQHDASNHFNAARVRKYAVAQRNADIAQREIRFGKRYADPEPPPGCTKQEAFYRRTGILMLSDKMNAFFKRELPQLHKAYEQFDESNPRALSEDVLSAVDSTWGTNVTMVDLEWQYDRDDPAMTIDVAHNPFELGRRLTDMGFAVIKDWRGLFDLMWYWFESAAICFEALKNKFVIEVCLGDVTSVLEQIRYGVVGRRQPDQPDTTEDQVQEQTNKGGTERFSPTLTSIEARPVDANQKIHSKLEPSPTMFDRIHLSNIPDYIGGTLFTFLYALPLTWPGQSSYVTANCLRNTPRWQSMAHFNNEHVGLSAPSDLEKAFHVRMTPMPNPEVPSGFVDYQKWHHCKRSTSLAELMSRDSLETWLYRLFLKLAIPKERPRYEVAMIYAPLNLSVFIRLCWHLHTVGYPAHWLSTVLNNTISGHVNTKARPPRSEPLKIREVKTDVPMLKQSTTPFVAELTTLLSMYQVSLPFGVLSPQIASIDAVRQYSYQLDDVPLRPVPEPNHFILAFFDVDFLPPGTSNLRPYLLSDETADRSNEAEQIRERGLHILTTWMRDRPSKTVSFWLRQDVMDDMRRGRWAVSIWRTDSWDFQSMPEPLSEIKDTGATWTDKLLT